MLAPDTRAVLLDQLRAPLGYRLDAAIATTFTLDLTAALIPPIAFASFQMRGTADPVAALEAVRSCADRVDIFCQAGQIRIPAQASDLMAFLEPMVHEVTPRRAGFLFHPKLWFLRYVAEDLPAEYRLLCLTRNLTLDPSRDVSLRLDGERVGRSQPSNRPLAALLAHLPTRTLQALPPERVARVEALAQDCRYVVWRPPADVSAVVMHAWGVPGARAQADFRGYRHLVVSPFCNDQGIRRVTEGSLELFMVCQADDLEALEPKTLAGIHSTFVLDPMAGLGDPDSDEVTTETTTFDGLHAKFVVVERARRAHLFVGSANATSAAYGGNVEFMVELVGGASSLGVEAFLSGDTGFGSILAPYHATGGRAVDPLDERWHALQAALRELASRSYTLSITAGKSGYQAVLTTESPVPVPEGHRATAELLTLPGIAHDLSGGRSAMVAFAGMPLPDITPFVVLRLTGPTGLRSGTVVRSVLIDDPPGRFDEVLARQIDTPDKFLRFLALLLGLTDPSTFMTNLAGEQGALGANIGPVAEVGVLELVLRALADHPESLRDLDRAVQRLRATEAGRAVLPPGFERLWSQVLLVLESSENPA